MDKTFTICVYLGTLKRVTDRDDVCLKTYPVVLRFLARATHKKVNSFSYKLITSLLLSKVVSTFRSQLQILLPHIVVHYVCVCVEGKRGWSQIDE